MQQTAWRFHILLMELRDIRAFIAVADEQHFGRAAARLFISQPPLSKRIKALEEEVGVPLFERTTRRVELTAAGRVFLEHARPLLDGAVSATRAAQLAERGQVGRVELGYIHSTSYTLLPTLLKACRLKLPGIELRLHELAVESQLDGLLDGRIDVALARLPIEHPRIETLTVVDEPLVLAIPAGHELARLKGSVHISRLADEQIIGYPPGGDGALHTIVSRLVARARLNARFAHVAGTLHTALGLVRAGEGVALVPKSLQVVRLEGVEYRNLTGAKANALLGLAWRTDRKSPAAAAFIALAKKPR